VEEVTIGQIVLGVLVVLGAICAFLIVEWMDE
jgi:hypothetical protein